MKRTTIFLLYIGYHCRILRHVRSLAFKILIELHCALLSQGMEGASGGLWGGDGGRPPMENQRDVPHGKLRGFTPMDGNLQECPPFEKISSQLSSFSQPINDLNLK